MFQHLAKYLLSIHSRWGIFTSETMDLRWRARVLSQTKIVPLESVAMPVLPYLLLDTYAAS